ncbi:fumarylacetoacetate hydrolase family protein [Agaribacter flavus]|uniref:Fumarylacetoacetate hydrolase family protein n=1 Tax=Agaribacter flavus TaxID=1902781 RepID=A0ABV7FJR8_9ALTE
MADYIHKDLTGNSIDLPVGKVLCVGRNYLDHIVEMGGSQGTSPKKGSPVLFMKPKTALCDFSETLSIPNDRGECHNELEVALLIGEKLSNASRESCRHAIYGVALGLDLTLRDLQNMLKDAGLPWERCKSFDASCPVSPFYLMPKTQTLDFNFQLSINGELRQNGDTKYMLWPFLDLLAEASKEFTIEPGDIVMTGTPKGVGPLFSGDTIVASLSQQLGSDDQSKEIIRIETRVC